MATARLRNDLEDFISRSLDDTESMPWMVEPEFQRLIVEQLKSILTRYGRRHRTGWRVFADLAVTKRRDNGTRVQLAPDLFVVHADERQRTSWSVDAEGRPPELVVEVVTEESLERDLDEKPRFYDWLGVREYIIFSPTHTPGGPRLMGYHVDAFGVWTPWNPDEEGCLRSEVLGGLRVYVEDGTQLRVLDAAGNRVLSADEVADQAEAEVARLRDQLRRYEQGTP